VLVASVPSLLDDLRAARDPFYYLTRSFDAGPSTLVTVARIVVFVIVQHILMLLPAVAVDAPGATWQNAVRDTCSHAWFVIVVSTLPFIPIGLLGVMVTPLLRGKRVKFPIPRHNQQMVRNFAALIDSGQFTPVIDRTFPFDQIVDAYRYVETGQKIGNVVLALDSADH
jgi:hypothetical protein